MKIQFSIKICFLLILAPVILFAQISISPILEKMDVERLTKKAKV